MREDRVSDYEVEKIIGKRCWGDRVDSRRNDAGQIVAAPRGTIRVDVRCKQAFVMRLSAREKASQPAHAATPIQDVTELRELAPEPGWQQCAEVTIEAVTGKDEQLRIRVPGDPPDAVSLGDCDRGRGQRPVEAVIRANIPA